VTTVSFRYSDAERAIYRKRERPRVSEWAARNIIVQDGPYAGSRLRMDVTPYMPGIMDTLFQPGVEQVAVCASPQVCKTELMMGCLFYSMEFYPGPKMLVMPDEDTLARAVQKKLLPRMRGSATLRRLYHRDTRNEVELRDGSSLLLASAMSPNQRAAVSIMHMFMDEVSLYRKIAGQGHPVTELRERTISYRDKRRVLLASKPMGDETDETWVIINHECDEIRRFHVACPACGAEQVMTLDRVKVVKSDKLLPGDDANDPRVVKRLKLGRYECEHCKYLWTDHARDVAVSRGRWVGGGRWVDGLRWENGDPVPNPLSVGFHLPSLVSRFVSLSEIAADRLAAEASGDPRKLKDYYNGRGALPFKQKEIETDEQKILTLRCDLAPRTVPRGAVALTCGVDVQKRGFWFAVLAWADSMESWLVDYGYIAGDWEEVATLHDARYPVEGGGDMGVWRLAYDSGGGKTDSDQWTRTEEVYLHVRKHAFTRRVFATKGASREQVSPVRWTTIDKLPRSGRLLPGGLQLATIDTDYFKGLLHGRMAPDARQALHLHSGTGEDFAAQVAAERLVRAKSGELVWEQFRQDNHYLDCLVLASACADPSWVPSLQMLARAQRKGREGGENQAVARAGQVGTGRPMAAGDVKSRILGRRG